MVVRARCKDVNQRVYMVEFVEDESDMNNNAESGIRFVTLSSKQGLRPGYK